MERARHAEASERPQPAQPNAFFAKVLADQHYARGRDLEGRGYWEQALLSYRRACRLDPANVLFLLARGHICQAHHLEPEAEECYRVALSLRPDDTVVLYNQAQLFASRGQLDEARANLAKIVVGGVDALGERAAAVFGRLGDIALRREDYAAAAVHYRKAAEVAPADRYALASLDALPRLAEFRTPIRPDGQMQPKLAVYAYSGAMLLGMPSDNGIDVPISPGLGFDSLEDLAQTLARFVWLARQLAWRFDAVVALEAESQPLANGLAAVLGGRPIASVELAPRNAIALGVAATGSAPDALRTAVAALRDQCPLSLVYSMGLRHPIWAYAPLLNVVSMPVLLEFPWSRGEAAAAEHAEAFGAELGRLLAATPPDGSVARQLGWYGAHRKLSFDPRTMAPKPPDGGDGTRRDAVTYAPAGPR
jgi:tetratricopeptide (TPR) repeat protein